MTVRQDIAGVINNDLQFIANLTYNKMPLNLTGYSVYVIVKPSQISPDSAGTIYAAGSGITVISAVAGRIQFAIPRAATGAAGTQWYRVDVSNGSQVSTAMLGSLALMAA